MQCFFVVFFLNGVFAHNSAKTTKEDTQHTKSSQMYKSPIEFTESLVNKLLHFISTQEELSVIEQEETLIKLSRKYFNIDRISKMILASNFKTLTPDQFNEFKKYYEIILIKTLIAFFKWKALPHANDITVEDFEVTSKKLKEGFFLHHLSSFIQLSEEAPLSLKLLIIEKDNAYEVFTVSIENLDYIQHQQRVHSSLDLSSPENIDALLSNMREKSKI